MHFPCHSSPPASYSVNHPQNMAFWWASELTTVQCCLNISHIYAIKWALNYIRTSKNKKMQQVKNICWYQTFIGAKTNKKQEESHQEFFLGVFQHRPHHPNLGLLSRSASRLDLSYPPLGVETPPAERYIISHQGAPTNCCFPPQLASKKIKRTRRGGKRKKPTAFVSDNCDGERVRCRGVDGERERDWMSNAHAPVLFQHLSAPPRNNKRCLISPSVWGRRPLATVCSQHFN